MNRLNAGRRGYDCPAPAFTPKNQQSPLHFMNKTLITLAAGIALLATPAAVHAAKDPDKKAAKQAIKAVLADYDKNGNGIIDGDEKDAIKKAYEADTKGPLKRFDLNNDGKLDDTEIAAIHKKKGKKKSA